MYRKFKFNLKSYSKSNTSEILNILLNLRRRNLSIYTKKQKQTKPEAVLTSSSGHSPPNSVCGHNSRHYKLLLRTYFSCGLKFKYMTRHIQLLHPKFGLIFFSKTRNQCFSNIYALHAL